MCNPTRISKHKHVKQQSFESKGLCKEHWRDRNFKGRKVRKNREDKAAAVAKSSLKGNQGGRHAWERGGSDKFAASRRFWKSATLSLRIKNPFKAFSYLRKINIKGKKEPKQKDSNSKKQPKQAHVKTPAAALHFNFCL